MIVAMWLSLIGCGMVSEESSTVDLRALNISERTIVMEDTWIIPHTTVVPVIDQVEPKFVEAENLSKSGNNMASAQLLLSILQDKPDFVAAHSLLSSVFIKLGDIEQALNAAHRVVELQSSAWSHSNLATIYILKQDFDLAKKHLETSLEMNPKYFLSLRNLGSIAYQERDYEAAERYFRQFIRIEPEDTYGYVSYGQILVEQGKLETAKEVYLYRLEELALDPESVRQTPSGLTLDLPLALAEVYRRLGEEEDALRWLKKGIVWSWTYSGHWTEARVYEDKAYTRLIQILNTYSTQEQMAMAKNLGEWCASESLRVKQEGKCQKLTDWMSTLNLSSTDQVVEDP